MRVFAPRCDREEALEQVWNFAQLKKDMATQLITNDHRWYQGDEVAIPCQVRRSIDAYFEREGIRPKVVAEVADSAMLKVLGAGGIGVFPVPAAIEDSAKEQFSVELVGAVDSIRESFYAISTERRVRNPAVLAICTTARNELFDI